MKHIINKNNVDTTKQPLFFGEGLNLQRYDKYRYKKIIVYCRSGNRSGTATKILNENGFTAYNMLGGMNEWKGEVVNQESELHLND